MTRDGRRQLTRDHLPHLMRAGDALNEGVAAEYEGQAQAEQLIGRHLIRNRMELVVDDDAANPRYLLTENHIGYRFADPDDRPMRGRPKRE